MADEADDLEMADTLEDSFAVQVKSLAASGPEPSPEFVADLAAVCNTGEAEPTTATAPTLTAEVHSDLSPFLELLPVRTPEPVALKRWNVVVRHGPQHAGDKTLGKGHDLRRRKGLTVEAADEAGARAVAALLLGVNDPKFLDLTVNGVHDG